MVKYSFVCSEHFKPDDFRPDHRVTLLKPDAVPAIFSFLSYL